MLRKYSKFVHVNFSNEKSLNQFIKLYYCQEDTKDEKKCDKSIGDYLKK